MVNLVKANGTLTYGSVFNNAMKARLSKLKLPFRITSEGGTISILVNEGIYGILDITRCDVDEVVDFVSVVMLDRRNKYNNYIKDIEKEDEEQELGNDSVDVDESTKIVPFGKSSKKKKRSRKELELERKEKRKAQKKKESSLRNEDQESREVHQTSENNVPDELIVDEVVSKDLSIRERQKVLDKPSNVFINDFKKAEIAYAGSDAKMHIFLMSNLLINTDDDMLKFFELEVIKQIKNIETFLKIANNTSCYLSNEEREFLVDIHDQLSQRIGIEDIVPDCISLYKNTYRSGEIREFAGKIRDALESRGVKVLGKETKSSNSFYLVLDYGMLGSIRISDHDSKRIGYNQNLILYSDCYRRMNKKANKENIITYTLPYPGDGKFDVSTVLDEVVNTVEKERYIKKSKKTGKPYRNEMCLHKKEYQGEEYLKDF